MFEYVEFESKYVYWHSRKDCLVELTSFLNTLGNVDIVDIEKSWHEDKNLADYKPRNYLTAFIIYKEKDE